MTILEGSGKWATRNSADILAPVEDKEKVVMARAVHSKTSSLCNFKDTFAFLQVVSCKKAQLVASSLVTRLIGRVKFKVT